MVSVFDASARGSVDVRWWKGSDDAEVSHLLKHVYEALDERDSDRQALNLHHMRLYGNMPVEGISPGSYNRVANKNRVTLNVVANVCDSATARIGKAKPLPRPLPVIGNYSVRRKAKLLERFFAAQYRVSRVYDEARKMFLDACVLGTGALKCYADVDAAKIRVERVFPSELLVDPHEALYGEPRTLLQRKWVSRDVLREMFLEGDGRKDARLSDVLEKAGNEWRAEDRKEGDAFADDGIHDQVLVVEAWHLPSGPDADDGKHAIITDAGPLLVEDWAFDYFPFVFFRWKKGLRGFWGHGLAEELNGIQVEINRMLLKIQTAFHLLSLPRIFIDAASKIQKAHINNEIGAFVPYVGNPPVVSTPQTFHPEFFQHLERLYQKAFEIAGLSQDTATPGMQSVSGISAQTQHEIGTERFSIQLIEFEDALVERLAPQMVDRAKEIVAAGKKFGVPSHKDRESIEHIDWSEIDLADDEYVLQVFRQSSLPTLPGPRQDRVMLLMEAGLVDPATAKELLDLPDLEAHMALDRAASDDIDRIIELMLDEGKTEAPEPYMDLQLALKKVQLAYNLAKKNGVEEERLELLRRFMTRVHALQQKAAMEQQKLAMAAGEAGGMMSQGLLPPSPGAPPAPGIQGAPPTAVQPADGVM